MQQNLHHLEHLTESVSKIHEPSAATLRNIMLYANVVRWVEIFGNREISYSLN